MTYQPKNPAAQTAWEKVTEPFNERKAAYAFANKHRINQEHDADMGVIRKQAEKAFGKRGVR